MNYFTESEVTKFTKNEIMLHASFGLQSCKTKSDVIEILEDIWDLANLRR